MFTSGLICSEYSLSGSDDPLGDIAELLLLLGAKEGVGVRHLDSAEEEDGEIEHIATRYQVIRACSHLAFFMSPHTHTVSPSTWRFLCCLATNPH